MKKHFDFIERSIKKHSVSKSKMQDTAEGKVNFT
jgi:hypothetical protein